jgi:aspartyl-tRNA synthetase
MLLTGVDNIREVIAFPMNQQAQDILMGAPSLISDDQLDDLSIKIDRRDD